jgi:hypothetical protein
MIFGDRESSVAMTRMPAHHFLQPHKNPSLVRGGGGGYMHFILPPPLVVYDMQVGIVKQIENGPQTTDKSLSQALLVSQTPLIAFLDASNHFFDA